MEEFLKGGSGAVFIFFYLLPGFLGAMLYDYLSERDKPTNFDRIIDALVLTLVSSVLVHLCFGVPLLPTIKVDDHTAVTDIVSLFISKNILYISLCSVVISIIFSFLNNYGIIYYVLRFIKFTYKNGNLDVWYDTFCKHQGYWICIRYSDGRSLVGWAKFYSSYGKPRELFIAEANWWEPNPDGTITASEVLPGVYISDFTNVLSIELLD